MCINEYRVWDKEQKKMLYYDADIVPCLTLNGVLQGENHTNVSSRYILMKYVGIDDKNGKKIYENDIVWRRYPRKKGSYSKWGGSTRKIIRWVKTKQKNGWNIASGKDVTIIGNVFETPELIQQYKLK